MLRKAFEPKAAFAGSGLSGGDDSVGVAFTYHDFILPIADFRESELVSTYVPIPG
jgi:hypothetical protein